MADNVLHYYLGCPHDALKAETDDVGRYTNIGWMPKNSFGTRWVKFYLLTSPFIERISLIDTDL
jgi:hypothetical protein